MEELSKSEFDATFLLMVRFVIIIDVLFCKIRLMNYFSSVVSTADFLKIPFFILANGYATILFG